MASRSPSLSPPPLKRRRLTSLTTTQQPRPISRPRLQVRPNLTKTHSIRIYAWNINGIAPYVGQQPSINTYFPTKSSTRSSNPPAAQPSLRACLRRWSFPHIICLQEVKVAPSDTSSQASVRRVINTPLSKDEASAEPTRLYDAHFNLPQDKHNAIGFGGKVYGVCTLVRRDLGSISRTYIVDWDLEGRVLITELQEAGLVVLNIYAVNGTTNPFRDPNSGTVVGDRHMRKRIFHSKLRDECSRYEAQGWNVVIAGDMNISQTHLDSYPQLRMGKEHVVNRQHFVDTFTRVKEEGGLGMRDSFRGVHGERRSYSYRPPGKVWGEGMDRVDLILVSEGTKIVGADILDSELERGRSDHVPLWVEIGIENAKEEVKIENEKPRDEVG